MYRERKKCEDSTGFPNPNTSVIQFSEKGLLVKGQEASCRKCLVSL